MDTVKNQKKEIAVFGGGCFWCTEAIFKMIKGVAEVKPGYAIGKLEMKVKPPTYEQVSTGMTGYAESVYLEYNPTILNYRDLLTIFFGSHDPTTLNRQGADIGTQYRSAIFYTNENQREEALKFIKEINDSSVGGKPVITEVSPLGKFYEAEDYHKDYYNTHSDAPYCQIIINPKLEKVQKRFSEFLKTL